MAASAALVREGGIEREREREWACSWGSMLARLSASCWRGAACPRALPQLLNARRGMCKPAARAVAPAWRARRVTPHEPCLLSWACAVRGDLIRILNKLLSRRSAFDAIVVETTGLANPAPVIQVRRAAGAAGGPRSVSSGRGARRGGTTRVTLMTRQQCCIAQPAAAGNHPPAGNHIGLCAPQQRPFSASCRPSSWTRTSRSDACWMQVCRP